ncbi:hypothetical protein DE146DRAFT_754947 [Phaeosphaeria sp. MPI-PUGE-AT-0046c]|nr:hypothetical protein DE146DRAFT_754947 [Phaeosphaeria sp. MPI-PUGE-AT-0046c]
MTKDHRFFHRRQAGAATKILTVQVEVVATVDTSGNLVGQETRTQADLTAPTPVPGVIGLPQAAANVVASVAVPAVSAVGGAINALTEPIAQVPPAVPIPAVPSLPQVPAVPAVPTVALPTVPSVPPFPSDLAVPAYPWPSGVSAAALQVSAAPASPSPSPTSVLGSASSASSLAALISVSNSTLPSTSPLASASLSARSASVSASDSASFAMSSRSGPYTSTATDPSQRESATSAPAGGTGVGGGPINTADPALNTAAAGSSSSGPTIPLQTPQVVGSVVGSLAGAALILAIILFLLRRHKRQRRGALQLTGDEQTDRVPPMSQDPSNNNNRIPSTFLNRFSGMSKSTIDTNTSVGEPSFQRVSGRKLPSAFSEGMTSDQFSRGGGTLSGSSFYTDDQGTYGGPGTSKEFGKEYGKEIGGSAAAIGTGMSFRPGPARTPMIRHPDDDYSNPFADPAPFPRDTSHLSPPQSPNPDLPRNTLGRSLHSHDGSRSSKFTENV